jgi:hypothetical protein
MPKLAQESEIEGRVSAPGRISAVAAQFGLKLANNDECREARAIAARLIGEGIASAETFAAVQAITRASIFVHYEGRSITGMLGLILLRPVGLRAVQSGTFDGVTPDPDVIARPGETPAACYGWGFAGVSEAGGGAAVKAAVAMQRLLFWRIPVFTRTATADGVRVILGKMGYQVYSVADPTLVWRPAALMAPAP